jgi:hypothetical protein
MTGEADGGRDTGGSPSTWTGTVASPNGSAGSGGVKGDARSNDGTGGEDADSTGGTDAEGAAGGVDVLFRSQRALPKRRSMALRSRTLNVLRLMRELRQPAERRRTRCC